MARAVRSGTRVDVAMLAVCGFLSLLALVLPDNLRGPAAAGLRRSVVAPLLGLQKRAELSRTALLTHDAERARVDSLALRALSAQALEAENRRLRGMLGLGQRLGWGFVPAEALFGDGAREEFTLTLTAGGDAGVRPFSPVVAPEGLVGMVQTVDPTLSLAITWSHPDFRVSAQTVDGSAFGIVAAHLGTGVDRYLLELRGVPFRNELKPGTLIASSGLGGVYPPGIPVGTVLRELRTAEGWARTYLVRPAVLPSNIGSVMILRPQRVQDGVRGVWTSVAAADSAARATVAAADSMTRDSTRAVARQQATLDSARRAALPVDTARTPVRADTSRPAPVHADTSRPAPR